MSLQNREIKPLATSFADTRMSTTQIRQQDNGTHDMPLPTGNEKKTFDSESVALLRQIFPDLSDLELQKLHKDRLMRQQSSNSAQEHDQQLCDHPTSNLGQRVWREWLMEQRSWKETSDETTASIRWKPVELPVGFLQLPSSMAVRRFNEKNGKWYYLLVKYLENQVLDQHLAQEDFTGFPHKPSRVSGCYSRAVYRDVKIGLGMSLCEEGGRVLVHSLVGLDGRRWFVTPSTMDQGGPAMLAGVKPGHWLLGINGYALIPMLNGHEELVHDAVSLIQYSADPVVLHLQEVKVDDGHLKESWNQLKTPYGHPSQLDMTALSMSDQGTKCRVHDSTAPTPRVHPFVLELELKGIINGIQDKIRCTNQLKSFIERARQWESFASFRLNALTYSLCPHFDHRDMPIDGFDEHFAYHNVEGESFGGYTPSTPMLDPSTDNIPAEYLNSGDELSVLTEDDEAYFEQVSMPRNSRPVGLKESLPPGNPWQKYPGQDGLRRRDGASNDIFIPLGGLRKALCLRIVNSFVDGVRTAYTIWVFDVESGCEWYAPVRYQSDFQDLRSVALPLCPSLAQLPFPQTAWKVFAREKAETEEVRDTKCRQLEFFLRKLSTLLYTDTLHPMISEIAIHLQSFLGCDGGDGYVRIQTPSAYHEHRLREAFHGEAQRLVRIRLKRSIQRYVYRLFLLEPLQNVVNDFVDSTRERALKLREIEVIESQGRNNLKQRAMEDLGRIQAFLDQLQKMITKGCRSDFNSICQRRNFASLRHFMEGSSRDTYVDRICQEAVREQIEIEVYVPLRGVISRLLVNGWRHEDMEIHFKMNELRRRPQSAMRIPPGKESSSGWSSASTILGEGVGLSTLPCAKLRAIVDAATEISRLFVEEKRITEGLTQELGADDFLPIFIYCVVHAQIERPCALCVLLQTLCEPANRIGEIGYYLASFEAALTHIQELSLTETYN